MSQQEKPDSRTASHPGTSELPVSAENSQYLDALYQCYLKDATSLPLEWREYFSALSGADSADSPPLVAPHAGVDPEWRQKQMRVLQLINAYRFLGHLQARTNPLLDQPKAGLDELTLTWHELSEADLETSFNTGSLHAPDTMTLAGILQQLQQSYCGSVGVEYMHIPGIEEKRWIQRRLEGSDAISGFSDTGRCHILERLTAAEALEKHLHSHYVGQKRFSLEGAESLIPLLDDLIQHAGAAGVREIVFGMAHRGRLNVLVNILGKLPGMLFREFEEQTISTGRTGDVKYHMGFASDLDTPGGPVHVAMAFNPSHLEIVGPVVEGAVRARQDRWEKDAGDRVLSVVIHGDAAFAGQGVVTETFNLSQTRGYKTRGTVHIIINNQIGFTTNIERDSRSTFYCSDVSKMLSVPVFHVNGDDPEAVVFITRVAFEYRKRFHKDVVIDLVCYRRQGHNEADEPAVTQPLMYQKVRALSTTREKYLQHLFDQQVLCEQDAENMVQSSRKLLEQGGAVALHLLDSRTLKKAHPIDWKRFDGGEWDQLVDTSISESVFRDFGERISTIPDSMHLHPRVERVMAARRDMVRGEQAMDWGFCETLAYATLMEQGFAVRLSGQDSSRGTFFHRHAVLYDQNDGHSYVPLKNLSETQSSFVVIDSILSEEAVLAFEYGYATTEPDVLVIWESQFGDFANNAQVVIDQFISSGEQKWGRLSGLVMFLPHGYEGQGPEHSSARIERYLQLCSQMNMQVCAPTTPAQVFHMLRRQMLRRYRKPLIVITPKSMLRHPQAVSTIGEITGGGFRPVIDEVDSLEAGRVTRLILCMGKIYYDLLEKRRSEALEDIAIVRIEQLYPFPGDCLADVFQRYPHLEQVVWCQEEPRNQGAWYSQKHHLQRVLRGNITLECVGRPAQASSAVGSLKVHREQQRTLVATALGLAVDDTA